MRRVRDDCVDGDDIFGTGGVPKISSRPSPSSRRGLDALERNEPSGVGTGILVNYSVLVFQPACVHIEIPGKGVGLHFQIQNLNKLCCGACPLCVQLSMELFQNRVWRDLTDF